MQRGNSKLEPNDFMYLVTDDETDIPNLRKNKNTTYYTSEDEDGVHPWDTAANITASIPNLKFPKCRDIFLDDDSLMSDIPKSKTKKACVQTERVKSKKKTTKKKKSKCEPTPCEACEKSRQYLEYLTGMLEDLQKKQCCGAGGDAKMVKKKRRCRRPKPDLVPRCACPAPCGDADMHEGCTDPVIHVPRNMGWNWKLNSEDRRGWKPGAIPKSIREIMGHFLRPCPCDTLPNTKEAQPQPRFRPQSSVDPSEPNRTIQRPMIQLHRENDELTITMRPLKNSIDLKSEPDPYAQCDPIKLRISGIKEAQQMNQIKKILAEKRFTKCCCGRPVADCRCRDNREMDAVRKCLNDLESKFGVQDLDKKRLFGRPCDDLQLDFTPPAGILKPKLNEGSAGCETATAETQYSELDYKGNKHEKGAKGDKGEKGDKSGADGDGKGKKKKGKGSKSKTSSESLSDDDDLSMSDSSDGKGNGKGSGKGKGKGSGKGNGKGNAKAGARNEREPNSKSKKKSGDQGGDTKTGAGSDAVGSSTSAAAKGAAQALGAKGPASGAANASGKGGANASGKGGANASGKGGANASGKGGANVSARASVTASVRAAANASARAAAQSYAKSPAGKAALARAKESKSNTKNKRGDKGDDMNNVVTQSTPCLFDSARITPSCCPPCCYTDCHLCCHDPWLGSDCCYRQ